MNITLEINESLWQIEADQQNASAKAKVDQQNSIGAKRLEGQQASLPPDKRIAFVPAVAPVVDVTSLVTSRIAVAEQELSDQQKQQHLDVLAQQPAADLERYVKVALLPQTVKDALAAQVDAIKPA